MSWFINGHKLRMEQIAEGKAEAERNEATHNANLASARVQAQLHCNRRLKAEADAAEAAADIQKEVARKLRESNNVAVNVKPIIPPQGTLQ